MPSITIKDIPGDVHRRLKERARLNRRSMQQEIMACLEAAVMPPRRPEAAELIDQASRLRRSIGRDLDHSLVGRFRREGRP